MRNLTIHLLCIILVPFFSDAQQTFLKKNDGFFIKEFSFSFDNDRIPFGTSDEDFTTGIRLHWKADYFHIPVFLGFRGKKKENDPVKKKTHFFRNFTSLSQGIYYYTPTELDNRQVDTTDRPYASFQYFSVGRYSDRRKFIGDGTSNSFERFESELQIGIVGGPLAKNLQRWTHEILPGGSPVPEGWDHQIGGGGRRLAINYALEYEAQWLSTRIMEKQKRKKYYGCHYYNLNQLLNLTAFLNGNIGNLRADFGFGLQLNFLNINNAQKYSLDFHDEGKSDFPSGSPPVIKLKDKFVDQHPTIFSQKIMKQEMSTRTSTWESDVVAKRYNTPQIAANAGIQQPIYYDECEEPKKRKRRKLAKQNAKKVNKQICDTLIFEIKNIMETLELDLSDPDRLQLEYTLDSLTTIHRILYKRLSKGKDIRPLLDSGSRFHNKRFAFNFFVRPELNYIAYNGMLQGLLFNDKSAHTIDIITPFVFEVRAGFNMKFDFMDIQFMNTFRSFEFPGNKEENLRPNKAWHGWGTITISVRPDMISDWFNRTNFRRRVKKNCRNLKKMY